MTASDSEEAEPPSSSCRALNTASGGTQGDNSDRRGGRQEDREPCTGTFGDGARRCQPRHTVG
eukprot:3668455-Rhodomonas_salina.2